ncbi:methyltransferase domain-containing protein [Shewanella sp. SR44-3]|uniref:methyltransferase domain-containing protein n=1 Tax=unclassified Shewanella TaxID=196818 RepID=UPI0015F90F14|nr:methyltransferase domain-containing protein [Shewanella sp. SR44-3]MBB1267976.1 class I SAM-dependent methyltransferase [Shewanella sp. SR44-3]
MRLVTKPRQWQQLPYSEHIKLAVETQLASWWPKVFGYHLLKLGSLSAGLDSQGCSISRHYSVFDDTGADIIADPHHLPLKNTTIDTVLMSFLIEFETNPYRLLREVDRVLISGGYVIIVGFNPISPLFMGKVLSRYQTRLPWCGQFFMPSRVKDWLGLLGYQVLEDSRSLYHPLIRPFAFGQYLEQSLQRWLPGTGSVYFIVARKLDAPLTPIRDKKRPQQHSWSPAPSAGRLGDHKLS